MKKMLGIIFGAVALFTLTLECKYENKALINKSNYSLTVKWTKSSTFGKKKIVKTETLKPQGSTYFETDEFSAEIDPAQAPTELKNKALIFKTDLDHLYKMELEELGCPEGPKKKSSLYGCVSAMAGADDWEVDPKIINTSDLPK